MTGQGKHPIPRMPPASRLGVAFLLMLLLAPAALAAEGSPIVTASRYRFDLGPLLPGEAREEAFLVTNPGAESVVVSFLQEGAPRFARLSEEFLILPPGETRPVTFDYLTPPNATPGAHTESIRLVVTKGVQPTSRAEGTLHAGTAILLTSRTTSVGIAGIEAPPILLPQEPLQGRVLLVNTWSAPVVVRVTTTLRDPQQNASLEMVSPSVEIPAGGSVADPFRWPGELPLRGTYTLEARLDPVAPTHAPVGDAFRKPLAIGVQEATYDVLSLVDTGKGDASVTLLLRNTGDVPITITPRVRMTPTNGTGEPYEVDLAPVTLQPGETRTLETTIRLPPGNFALSVVARNSLGFLKAAEPIEATLLVAQPRAPGVSFLTYLPWIVLGLSAIAAGATLRHPEARAWAKARLHRPAKRRAPPAPDALDLFLASLEAEETRRAPTMGQPGEATVALLVDLPSLFGSPRDGRTAVNLDGLLERALHGRPLRTARAYLATDEPNLETARRALEQAGVKPLLVVSPAPSGHQEARLLLASDATDAARAGTVVIFATHDAAFAPLLRHLRAQGACCEVLAIEGHLPKVLEDVADIVHWMPDTSAPKRS